MTTVFGLPSIEPYWVTGETDPLNTDDDQGISRAKYEYTLIINEVIDTSIEMIEYITKSSASRAEALNKLIEWQNEYTARLSRMKAWYDGSQSGSHNVDQNEADKRNQMNAMWTESSKGRRDIISNQSDVMQNKIGSSSDSVSSQTNLCYDLISQLQSILSTIVQS